MIITDFTIEIICWHPKHQTVSMHLKLIVEKICGYVSYSLIQQMNKCYEL